MFGPFRPRYLGAGLLLLAACVGCSHRQQCTDCQQAYMPVYGNGPYQVSSSPISAHPTPAPISVNPPRAEAPKILPPTAELHDLPPVTQAPQPAMKSVSARVDDSTPRRSFADITARPEFAHAPDYSWMVGQLQYVHGRKAWRLRYASVDEEERYGGSVTLEGCDHLMDQYRSGQLVRVQGKLADPESRHPSPGFIVADIRPEGN